ncbi:MAG: 16S rRNA (guanine(966)-N(2))-methyltransferase RsmD [Lentimicrobiaceae bacterium]|nr:16S rRNA (guanine(966)-N(2))-methyltransferase RsmD [Lentimicrobiaceae bacterium]
MRIISGNHRGKKIVAPPNLPVRPTTDFAKESLFNILDNYFYFDTVKVLDLFAGTGNISYEFAARGAVEVVAVDNNEACADFIEKTAKSLHFEQLQVVRNDALEYISHCKQPFNVIFADPPYDWDKYSAIPQLVFENGLLSPNGFLVIEHAVAVDFQQHPKFFQQRHYGKVNFSFFAENL